MRANFHRKPCSFLKSPAFFSYTPTRRCHRIENGRNTTTRRSSWSKASPPYHHPLPLHCELSSSSPARQPHRKAPLSPLIHPAMPHQLSILSFLRPRPFPSPPSPVPIPPSSSQLDTVSLRYRNVFSSDYYGRNVDQPTQDGWCYSAFCLSST